MAEKSQAGMVHFHGRPWFFIWADLSISVSKPRRLYGQDQYVHLNKRAP
jgi:hypothetical protein